MFLNILNDAKYVKTQNGAGAAQTAVTGTHVAMAGFNSVLLTVDLGTVTSGAVMQLTAQGGNAANDSDQANLLNPAGSTIQTAAITDSGGANSNFMFLLSLHKPSKAFIRGVFTRTTQNVVVNSMAALLYNCDQKPFSGAGVLATQDATIATAADFVSQ